MEAHDAFTGSATDDPFAGGEFGDFKYGDFESTFESTGPPDVVDREGNVVTPQAEPSGEPSAEPAAVEVLDAVEPEIPVEKPAVAEVSAEAAEAAAQASEPPMDPEPHEPEPERETRNRRTDALPEREPDDAPEPEGKKGRKYQVLQEVEPGVFNLVSWLVDKDGTMLPKGSKGRKQTIAMGHSTEDALKIGYAALGSPASVRLVAVAVLHFQVKTVAPEPVIPTKVKLQIR